MADSRYAWNMASADSTDTAGLVSADAVPGPSDSAAVASTRGNLSFDQSGAAVLLDPGVHLGHYGGDTRFATGTILGQHGGGLPFATGTVPGQHGGGLPFATGTVPGHHGGGLPFAYGTGPGQAIVYPDGQLSTGTATASFAAGIHHNQNITLAPFNAGFYHGQHGTVPGELNGGIVPDPFGTGAYLGSFNAATTGPYTGQIDPTAFSAPFGAADANFDPFDVATAGPYTGELGATNTGFYPGQLDATTSSIPFGAANAHFGPFDVATAGPYTGQFSATATGFYPEPFDAAAASVPFGAGRPNNPCPTPPKRAKKRRCQNPRAPGLVSTPNDRHAALMDATFHPYHDGLKTAISDKGAYGKIVTVGDQERFICHRASEKDPNKLCGANIKPEGKNLWNHDHKIHVKTSAYARNAAVRDTGLLVCPQCSEQLDNDHNYVAHMRRVHDLRNKRGQPKKY
ncbi:hypothetical protein JX266_009708 [Neoarthrinium moseri]|nr:hypothetical protein JX266_009708 [Neoarthrinium moseri]